MPLSEITFMSCAFVYNYTQVKPQDGGLIVALLRIPMLANTVNKYAKMSRRKYPLSCYINCVISYSVSVKLARKPLKMVEIANPHNSLNSTFWLRP